MLLRSSFSNTKKFFQKTLRSFKSFFSPAVDYHKLPKTSPYNPYSFSTSDGGGGGEGGGLDMNAQTSYLQQQQKQEDLEKFYSDFTDLWDSSDKGKAKKRNNNKKMMMSTAATQEAKDQGMKRNFVHSAKATSPVKSKRDDDNRDDHQYSKTRRGKVEKRGEDLYSRSKREERGLSVAQKLKEMEISNVDHVLDIEEVLHYYSRLTCPVYLDIVDKFFMELYTEFLGPPAASPKSVNSRPNFRSMRA